MANDFGLSTYLKIIMGAYGAAGAATAALFDSDYVVGETSGVGDCVGFRFVAPAGNVHVHDVYFFMAVAHPVGANLRCDLCPIGTVNTRAGASLDNAISAGGTTNLKWIKFTFTGDVALTPGTVYWLIIGDPAGATQGADGYQIRHRSTSSDMMGAAIFTSPIMYYSGDGFKTAATVAAIPTPFMVKFSDNSLQGNVYTTGAVDTSNTLERGLKFNFTEQVTCSGLLMSSSIAGYYNTFQIHEGADQPIAGTESLFSGYNGGSVHTVTDGECVNGIIQFDSPVTFAKNTVYRATFTYPTNRTVPGYIQVEDPATLGADGIALSYNGGAWCRTIDNGAGNGWTDQNNATDGILMPKMALILQDNPAIDVGGGGGIFMPAARQIGV